MRRIVVTRYRLSLEARGLAAGTKALHDLRRTCARLCHSAAGENWEEIRFVPGPSPAQTTERYLGCKQSLGHPVNDKSAPKVNAAVAPQACDAAPQRPEDWEGAEESERKPMTGEQQPPSEAKDSVVFDILRDSKCADCGQELS